jgi:iron complex outermembrane recepter protein
MRNALILACFCNSLLSFGQSILTGTVNNRFGSMEGVTIDVKDTHFGTITDNNGHFQFELDTGFYTIQVSAPGYQTVRKVVHLYSYSEAQEDFVLEDAILNSEVTIGSRSGEAINQLKSPVPIDVLFQRDLLSTGQTELGQALHRLLPNFFSVRQDSPEGTSFVDAISLRGLSPDQVLILVNGKRMVKSAYLNVNDQFGNGSAGADINSIPIHSIDRIEVLRDGASSQYGSDALAGVINILLKEKTSNIDVHLGGGITSEGDGREESVSASYGGEIDRGGFLFLNTTYLKREEVNRTGNYTGTIFADNPQQVLTDESFFEQTGLDDRRVNQIGSPEITSAALTFNSELDISKTMEMYAFGSIGFKNTLSFSSYRFPYQEQLVSTSLYGVLPQLNTSQKYFSSVLGIKGIVNQWHYDFGINQAKNEANISVSKSNNASMGLTSPTAASAGGYANDQLIFSIDFARTFEMPKSSWQVSFGAGFRLEGYEISSGEEESYLNDGDTTRTGVLGAPGMQGYFGIRPQDALTESRYNSSNYLEIDYETDFGLMIEGAGRYETYSDFGENFSYKFSGRYTLFGNTSMRGSYSTGFKAPSLQQLYYTRYSSSILGTKIVNTSHVNSESTVAGLFAVQNLKPEVSENFSIGLASGITKNLFLTVDIYRISIKDRIGISGNLDAGLSNALNQTLDGLDLDQVAFFTNTMDTRTRGFDIELAQRIELPFGHIRLEAMYSTAQTDVEELLFELPAELAESPDSNRPTGPDLSNFQLLKRNDIARYTSYIPSRQLRNSVSFNFNKFKIQFTHNAFGEVTYLHQEDDESENWVLNEETGQIESRDQQFSWLSVYNASVSWQLSHSIQIGLFCDNLLNTYPDEIRHSDSQANGVNVFSSKVQQYDMLGRFVSGRINIRL